MDEKPKFVLFSRSVVAGVVSLILALLSTAEGHEFIQKYPVVIVWLVTIREGLGFIFRFIARKRLILWPWGRR